MLQVLVLGNGYRIRHSLPQENSFEDKMKYLVSLASDFSGVPKQDILSKSRKRHISYLRSCVMFVARKRNYGTLTQIGLFFEGRDHSTVLCAIKNIERFIYIKDKEILGILKSLRYTIK